MVKVQKRGVYTRSNFPIDVYRIDVHSKPSIDACKGMAIFNQQETVKGRKTFQKKSKNK